MTCTACRKPVEPTDGVCLSCGEWIPRLEQGKPHQLLTISVGALLDTIDTLNLSGQFEQPDYEKLHTLGVFLIELALKAPNQDQVLNAILKDKLNRLYLGESLAKTTDLCIDELLHNTRPIDSKKRIIRLLDWKK